MTAWFVSVREGPMRVVLETPRLVLRHFVEADAELLLALDQDPEVTRYTGVGSLVLADHIERMRTVFFPQYARNPRRGLFAAIDKAGGEFLGWFCFRPATGHKFAQLIGWTRDDEMELGYRFKRSAWGRGLATEGAAALVADGLADPSVPRIVATALVTNGASCRVLEKVGLARTSEVSLPGFDAPAAVFELHPEPA
jgi:RimJ/RimL family protein N-acetyltransferase